MFDPVSILDVGCGDGAWVKALRSQGLDAMGLDTRPDAANENKWVVQGSASQLPFPDRSFDMVVSEFSAHHFPDLPGFMKEACRVAEKGIAILDPWYDDSIPSQQTARQLDEWFKRVDQACGEIHNFVISGGVFLDAMPSDKNFNVRQQHMLMLKDVPLAKYESWFDHYQEKAQSKAEELLQELDDLKEAIGSTGLSQDGAIAFFIDFLGDAKGG